MSAFGERLRRLRTDAGLNQPDLAKLIRYDQSMISKAENGRWLPSRAFVEACDNALDAAGALVSLAPCVPSSSPPADPAHTVELVRRLHLSDVDSATLETLGQATERLCVDYRWRQPNELRVEAQQWLRYIGRLLDRRVGLREHRELLVIGGWLALLLGCVDYDSGRTTAAEANRSAAHHLGRQAGHPEIVGWSCELAAWFALTQRALERTVDLARAGQQIAAAHGVAAQLAAHEARAMARMGDRRGVREAFDRGHDALVSQPSANPANHFTVSAERFEYFMMDGYRVAHLDDRAREYANEVLRKSTGRAPMREAQARMALGVLAARDGQLDQAAHHGHAAFTADRKCLPSLQLAAGELDREMRARFGEQEPAVRDFHEELRGIRGGRHPKT